jgi:hypothetical protein
VVLCSRFFAGTAALGNFETNSLNDCLHMT